MLVEHSTICPLCSKPVEMPERYCRSCDMKLNVCPYCGRLHPPWLEKCTYCGAQISTDRKLETGQADVGWIRDENGQTAEGRMTRLETGAEIPIAEKGEEEYTPAEDRAVITPNEQEELPPDWRFIAKESAWIPGAALLLIVYAGAEFSDSHLEIPAWVMWPVEVIAVISIVWLIIAGIAYILSPPRW